MAKKEIAKQEIRNTLENVASTYGMIAGNVHKANANDCETVKGGDNCIYSAIITDGDGSKHDRRFEAYLTGNGVAVWVGKSTPIYDALTALQYVHKGDTTKEARFTIPYSDVSTLNLLTVRQGQSVTSKPATKKSRKTSKKAGATKTA